MVNTYFNHVGGWGDRNKFESAVSSIWRLNHYRLGNFNNNRPNPYYSYSVDIDMWKFLIGYGQ